MFPLHQSNSSIMKHYAAISTANRRRNSVAGYHATCTHVQKAAVALLAMASVCVRFVCYIRARRIHPAVGGWSARRHVGDAFNGRAEFVHALIARMTDTRNAIICQLAQLGQLAYKRYK